MKTLTPVPFTSPLSWRRSAKGNLWRDYDGYRLTVFEKDDKFVWCIADHNGPQYSQRSFNSEQRAIINLSDVLEIE